MKLLTAQREKENEELNSLLTEKCNSISVFESTVELKNTEIEVLKSAIGDNVPEFGDQKENKEHGIGTHGFENKNNHRFQMSMVEDFQEYDAFTGKSGRITAEIPTESNRDLSTDLDLILRDKEEELEIVRSDLSNVRAALSLLEFRCYESDQRVEEVKNCCDILTAENDSLKYSLKAVADKMMKDDALAVREKENEREIGREKEREEAAKEREKEEEKLKMSQGTEEETETDADRLVLAMAQADILRQQLLQVM